MSKKPLALVLTQHYEPEPNFITQQVAAELARTHDVRVVTSHPQYPMGRFYPGTRWWTVSKRVEHGVTVYRVPMYPDHSLSAFRRLLSYLSFAFIAGITALVVAGRPRLVWIYHGPFVSGLAALMFRYLYGSRLVLTCADLWPESFAVAGLGMNSLIARGALRFRRWFNRQMHVVVCSTPGTEATFLREGIDRARLRFVPVWVPLLPSVESGSTVTPAGVVYVGNIGPAQNLSVAVQGCIQLCEEVAGLSAVFAGSGTELDALKSLAKRANSSRVTFSGRVSPSEARALCSHARAQIISLANIPEFEHTLPSKLGFSLAAGAPIVFCAPGETAAILRRLPGTFEYAAGDLHSFKKAVRKALALDDAARAEVAKALTEYYNSVFSMEAGLHQYREVFGQQLVKQA